MKGPTTFSGSSHWLTCMTAVVVCHAIVHTSTQVHALRGGATSKSCPQTRILVPRAMDEGAIAHRRLSPVKHA